MQSDYKHESAAESLSESDHLEAGSEEDSAAAKTPRGHVAKRTNIPMHKKKDGGAELWKSGAKLELGTQVIIKKPKARDVGDTPFTNETIHPNTMLFLRDLAAHNDRQWLKGASAAASCTCAYPKSTHFAYTTIAKSNVAHDADYRTSLQDFTTFLESLSEKVIEADDTIPELPVKDIVSPL
jgi:hypothetical protein